MRSLLLSFGVTTRNVERGFGLLHLDQCHTPLVSEAAAVYHVQTQIRRLIGMAMFVESQVSVDCEDPGSAAATGIRATEDGVQRGCKATCATNGLGVLVEMEPSGDCKLEEECVVSSSEVASL